MQRYTEMRYYYYWFWHNKPIWDYVFPESRTMNQGVINIYIDVETNVIAWKWDAEILGKVVWPISMVQSVSGVLGW